MFIMGAVATFPLFVPPFLLPLYVSSVGLSKQTGAAILACWNLASAVGRIGMGFGADAFFGPVNSMLFSLTVIGVTAMALWPFASSLGLLVFFAIMNGMASGGFFSLMPVVVGAVFGDGQLAIIMSMLISSWTIGYFMVSHPWGRGRRNRNQSIHFKFDANISDREPPSRATSSRRTAAPRAEPRRTGPPSSTPAP